MAQPTTHDVHIDTALSNISIAHRNEGYVADLLFPQVPVDKQSDYYYVWTKDFWFRDHTEVRGPGGTYAEGGMELSSTQFECINRALSFPLPWDVLENQDAAVNLETAGAEWLSDQFALNRELKLKALIMDAGAWTSDTTLSGGSQWSDYANSNPISDVETGRQAIKKLTGTKPNVLFMNEEVWSKLKNHPDLIDLFKHTQTGILTEALVASVLNVDRLIVGDAVKNTAAEGAVFSGSYIWDKNAILMYVPSSPGLMIPAAGYAFSWKQNGYTIAITREEERLRKRDLLLADHAFIQKVTAADTGYEIINAVA